MQITCYGPLFLLLLTVAMSACREIVEQVQTDSPYVDVTTDTTTLPMLYAVSDEEYLQYGADVSYVTAAGDTIVPFGHFAYYGTDSFTHVANVILHPNDSTYGRQVGINRYQDILFDLVMYDNGPEPLHDGLLRVLRNGKMGFANEKGQIVIPCIYDYVQRFDGGQAEVTFEATEYYDLDDHLRVESDTWFDIDRHGKRIITP
ncbi:WG repeat-containing protein [Reichenbachiella agariperforans]|uniref:WG repeat-containing protein n=1 Tax=Reichenbachiella agariperforans TaxID=156994 RepID=UPI001C093571|nr:WG repeat-containing protein [Reichenbachiella agariperforans]MBU2912834.1 WG repeat-containing protein [Reichenbachiella agariperforans]